MLTSRGHRVFDLPTGCDHAPVLLEAEPTAFLQGAIAAVSFLEAAAGGSREKLNDQQTQVRTREYLACGHRLSGVQDDLLRHALFTMLAM